MDKEIKKEDNLWKWLHTLNLPLDEPLIFSALGENDQGEIIYDGITMKTLKGTKEMIYIPLAPRGYWSKLPPSFLITAKMDSSDKTAVLGNIIVDEEYKGILQIKDSEERVVLDTTMVYLGQTKAWSILEESIPFGIPLQFYTEILDSKGMTIYIGSSEKILSGTQTTIDLPLQVVNFPPQTKDLSLTVDRNLSRTANLQAQDRNEGDSPLFVLDSLPQKGSIELNGETGEYKYTPFLDEIGEDFLSYTRIT